MNPKITCYPVNNGDATMIETGDEVVLVDVNYRESCTDPNSDAYDFAPELRRACRRSNGRHELDVFVLSHPDQDHLGGADKLLYLDEPDDYEPDEEEPLILVRELWVSPYALNAYETDASKPMLTEVRRRHGLVDTPLGDVDGNRLKVLSVDDGELMGDIGRGLQWALLGPTREEATIPMPDDEDEPRPSCNDSSLVIRWTLLNGEAEARLLLGGDAGVDVWERIQRDYGDESGLLDWHVLLAPHHCSRTAMARKNEDTGQYDYSQLALDALGHVEGGGFVISSSKPVRRDDDNPPSWEAKQRYLQILRKGNPDGAGDRFLNPESHRDGSPAPVVFELTRNGLRRKVPAKVREEVSLVGLGMSEHSRYG